MNQSVVFRASPRPTYVGRIMSTGRTYIWLLLFRQKRSRHLKMNILLVKSLFVPYVRVSLVL